MEKGNTSLLQVRVWIPDLSRDGTNYMIKLYLSTWFLTVHVPVTWQNIRFGSASVGFLSGSDKLRKKIAALHSCTDGGTISMLLDNRGEYKRNENVYFGGRQ